MTRDLHLHLHLKQKGVPKAKFVICLPKFTQRTLDLIFTGIIDSIEWSSFLLKIPLNKLL